MARPLVLVPSSLPDADRAVVERVLGDDAELVALGDVDVSARRALLERAAVLLVFAWKLEPDELSSLRTLGLIQSAWAGVDRVPLEAVLAVRPEVQVATTSGVNAAQVAEHALGLYLDCARGITWRDRSMRSGGWPQRVPAQRVAGSRVAVVGHGSVGRRVARGLAALDAEVVVVNRSGQSEEGWQALDLHGLRSESGALSGVVLALPLTAATRGLVDRRFLEGMPEDGILVNVGRGPVVVEGDLYAHLLAHPRFSAGLDVWWHYPKGPGVHLQRSPFHALPNVVMTPHSAFQAPEARLEMIEAATRNIVRHLRGEPVLNLVRT